MAVIYRYVDLSDEQIKYVGIVWSGNRTLKQRDAEHVANDDWCKNGSWRVEYLSKEIKTRTDAEMLEAHYISKFGTDKYFNIRKAGWGTSDLISDADDDWKVYRTDEEQASDLKKTVQITDASIIQAPRQDEAYLCRGLMLKTEDNLTFILPWADDMLYWNEILNIDSTPTTWCIFDNAIRAIILDNISLTYEKDAGPLTEKDALTALIENCSISYYVSEISGDIIKFGINFPEIFQFDITFLALIGSNNTINVGQVYLEMKKDADPTWFPAGIEQQTNCANFATFMRDNNMIIEETY